MYEIRTIDQYTPEEKIAAFDDFYAYAKEIWDYATENERPPKDSNHYAYENLMELLANNKDTGKFWEEYNRIVP